MMNIASWRWKIRWLQWQIRKFLKRHFIHRYSVHSIGWQHRSRSSAYRSRRVKPAWVTHEVIRLKALIPQAGCRVIAHTFNRLYGPHTRISKSYVASLVRRHRYAIEIERRRIKHRVPRPQKPNHVWALDLTGRRDAQGSTQSIFGLIDHGSRALLDLRPLPNKRSLTLLGHLFLAMGKYGQPRVLRTDNEAVFRSHLFRLVLKLIKVRQQFSDRGCPWQNGRIERLFGTLKQSLDQIQIDNCLVLGPLLNEFRCHYNHVRPHQHLAGATPAEVWVGVDWTKQRIKRAYWFSGWGGMLTGYYLRR